MDRNINFKKTHERHPEFTVEKNLFVFRTKKLLTKRENLKNKYPRTAEPVKCEVQLQK